LPPCSRLRLHVTCDSSYSAPQTATTGFDPLIAISLASES
jgi:hypothetical protein